MDRRSRSHCRARRGSTEYDVTVSGANAFGQTFKKTHVVALAPPPAPQKRLVPSGKPPVTLTADSVYRGRFDHHHLPARHRCGRRETARSRRNRTRGRAGQRARIVHSDRAGRDRRARLPRRRRFSSRPKRRRERAARFASYPRRTPLRPMRRRCGRAMPEASDARAPAGPGARPISVGQARCGAARRFSSTSCASRPKCRSH